MSSEGGSLPGVPKSPVISVEAASNPKSGRHSGERASKVLSARLFLWAFAGAFSLWLLGDKWHRLYNWAYKPHQLLYYNGTLEGVTDPREVVWPLVDEKQRFNVVATVWSRKEGADREAEGSEDVIFSDVIFSGLTLKSKGAQAQVNLSIPLHAFETSENLENYDLRASFTLVPQSPSLLDGLEEYKSWLPTWLKPVAMSPLKDVNLINDEERLKQEAIDSFGITIPLIGFGPVKSPCGREPTDQPNTRWTPGIYTYGTNIPIESTRDRPAAQAHPYVSARTDLRVVTITELYDAKCYHKYQQALYLNDIFHGCDDEYVTDPDQRVIMMPQDVRNWHRSFRLRGNMETAVKVRMPTVEPQSPPVHVWAYAPFLDVVPGSHGPMDLVPMPINREECPGDAKTERSLGPSTLNVTWNIAFSGSSPGYLQLAGVLAQNPFSMRGPSSAPYERAKAQSFAQHFHWLHGHKFSDKAHIGRSLAILGAKTFIGMIVIPRLHADYWGTRSSTVGISQLGAAITGIGGIALILKNQYKLLTTDDPQLQDSTALYLSLAFTALGVYMAVLTLAKALHLERVHQFPYFKKREASRREKTTLRVELQGRAPVLIIFVALFAYAAASLMDDFEIVPRVGPAPDDEPTTRQGRILASMKDFIPGALPALGGIYQLVLNYRLKTFAGQYKSAAWLTLFGFCLAQAGSLSWVVGELPLLDPLTLSDLLCGVPYIAAVVQAVRYPEVKQSDLESDHTD